MFELARSVYVSVAYRYWDTRWDETRNRQVYGELASPGGMGGNWRLEAALQGPKIGKVEGDVQAEAEALDQLQAALLNLKRLIDHRRLFTDEKTFFERASSLENVSLFLGQNLWEFALPQGLEWSRLSVFENEHVACVVSPQRTNTVELKLKVFNLTLGFSDLDPSEAGFALSREQVTQEVKSEYYSLNLAHTESTQKWGRDLFHKLQLRLPRLSSLRIDLTREKYILVEPYTV